MVGDIFDFTLEFNGPLAKPLGVGDLARSERLKALRIEQRLGDMGNTIATVTMEAVSPGEGRILVDARGLVAKPDFVLPRGNGILADEKMKLEIREKPAPELKTGPVVVVVGDTRVFRKEHAALGQDLFPGSTAAFKAQRDILLLGPAGLTPMNAPGAPKAGAAPWDDVEIAKAWQSLGNQMPTLRKAGARSVILLWCARANPDGKPDTAAMVELQGCEILVAGVSSRTLDSLKDTGKIPVQQMSDAEPWRNIKPTLELKLP
jgi:hypothetical protein